MPEYTGSLLSLACSGPPSKARRQPDGRGAGGGDAGEALPDDLEVLTPSAAEDKDVIVWGPKRSPTSSGCPTCRAWFAASSNITLGGPPELETRYTVRTGRIPRRSTALSSRGFVPLQRWPMSRPPSAEARSTAATCSRRCRRSPPRGSSRSRTTSKSCATRPCCRSCAARLSVRRLTGILDEVNAALDTETLAGAARSGRARPDRSSRRERLDMFTTPRASRYASIEDSSEAADAADNRMRTRRRRGWRRPHR